MSTDVETDLPIPGPHSMMSFGSAAYGADKELLAMFSATLKPLPGAAGHPETLNWWGRHPDAWTAATRDLRPAQEVMPRYAAWLDALPGRPVFVAYPAAFDFMFIYWYLIRFVGRSPFSHSALDIKTYAMVGEYRRSTKRAMPRSWFDDFPRSQSVPGWVPHVGQGLAPSPA